MMKAIVQDTYGAAEDVLELQEIDQPVLRDSDVLVRVHAAGLDQGVWHLTAGLPYVIRVMGFGLRAPKYRVPGSDVAGRVEAVGPDVTRFQPGDEIFGSCDGAFAEYARVREDKCAAKPANLSFEQAAAVPVSAITALQGLRDKAHVQAGQHVLIIGAGGGVGTFAVQLAKAFGANVTGVCSTAKTDLVRTIGADDVIDYTRDDITVAGKRYDVILDTGGNRPLSQLRRVLAPRGTLVIIGGEGGGRWLGGSGRHVRAIMLSPFVRQKLAGMFAVERLEDLETLRELIEAGKVTPAIDRTYPLSAAADAIRYMNEGRAHGKVVITM
jgi:NADPH:quinone reductase-like Zn-dependent oxidoreductase